MRIGVIGIGPIGGILSAHLANAGEQVFIADIDRGILSAAMDGGLKVTGPAANKVGGEFTARPAGAFSSISEAGELDAVFVCTKTTVQDSVASALKKTWRRGTTLISLQNGIDPEEMLAEVAGRENTLRVVVNYAGHMIEPCKYSVNWFTPPNYIGALTEKGLDLSRCETISNLLTRARLTTKTVDDIKKRAYEKTALNSSLCPVCTLTGLTMGEAMAMPKTRSLVIELLKEAAAIAERMGWKFEHTMDDWLKYLEAGGPHKTSMAEDMNAGRKTEILFMNGKLCEYGKKLGVPTPYNNAMVWAILGKESKR